MLGQSGTARAAPVSVTSPPKRISTNVAASVTSANRCATASPAQWRRAPAAVTGGAVCGSQSALDSGELYS